MTPSPESLALRLTHETGLAFDARPGRPGAADTWTLVPGGHDAGSTFQLVIRQEWRAIEVRFEHGAFSGALIEHMGRADAAGRNAFTAILGACVAGGAVVSVTVNGSLVNADDSSIWNILWRSFGLRIRKGQVPLDSLAADTIAAAVGDWACRAAAAIVALLPLEEADATSASDAAGLPEGARMRVEVNRYERDRRNRAAALAIHGTACKGCGQRLRDRYGIAAADLIEVHHVTPVSQLGKGYLIDPRTDLIPLCPNCHAVTHRREPPFTLAELHGLLRAGTPVQPLRTD
jgi:5-methylcytosine-specific restriction enzyme A